MTELQFRSFLEDFEAKVGNARPERLATAAVLHALAFGTVGDTKSPGGKRDELGEEWLTWILRPHRDAVVARDEQVAGSLSSLDRLITVLRHGLDDALDDLTCMEIKLQCTGQNCKQTIVLTQELREPLSVLAKSEAFLRYLNSYLYFGVRFFMGRDASIRTAWREARTQSFGLPDQVNRPLLLLQAPPCLPLKLGDQNEKAIDILNALSQSPPFEEQEALYFLDGFHQKVGAKTAQVEQKVAKTDGKASSPAVMGENPLPGAAQPPAAASSNAPREDANPNDLIQVSTVHDLELWLRGLLPEFMPSQEALPGIARGLRQWATMRAKQYDGLSEPRADQDGTADDRADDPKKAWRTRRCDTPRATRIALLDLYWLAGVLRAEVTPAGEVTYADSSWLSLLRFRETIGLSLDGPEPLPSDSEWPLERVEETLRSAFSSACELVQNASELEEEFNREDVTGEIEPRKGKRLTAWRDVFDAELDEIVRQRNLRRFQPVDTQPVGSSKVSPAPATAAAEDGLQVGWSRRLFEGNNPRDLVGIALSGGGIRSATFNLGVLQGLQELDLLRQVDFLSTVSGGGFIGSWLIANVKRTRYWLTRQTPWDDSVALLRKYSNYLAPRTGFFSMDTWSLGALWLRNTLLIQMTMLAWMLMMLTIPYLLRLVAVGAVSHLPHESFCDLDCRVGWTLRAAYITAILVVAVIVLNLLWPAPGLVAWRAGLQDKKSRWLNGWRFIVSARGIRWLAAFPAWVGSAIVFARLFGLAIQSGRFPKQVTNYSDIFLQQPVIWWRILIMSFAAFLIVLLVSLVVSTLQLPWQGPVRKWLRISSILPGAIVAAGLCTLVVHLCFSAITYGYLRLQHAYPHSPAGVHDAAFLAGPACVLLSYSLGILLLIGLSGKFCSESQREWWTRFGSYILAVALLGLLLCSTAFGSPWIIHRIVASMHAKPVIPTALLGWIATTVGGLLAGKSNKTSGEPTTKSISLELVARIGAFIFLVGAAVGSAELLYQFLHVFCPADTLHHVAASIAAFKPVVVLTTFLALVILTTLFSRFFEINIFGLNQLYRNRLVRCYLGATRWMPGMRSPEPFTAFDFNDDLDLSSFTTDSKTPFRGPFPIVNCTLNLAGSSDVALHTRHSASFSLTPLFCGSNRATVGYIGSKKYAGGVRLGQAVAISGAAASPNMGYNTSPLVAFLLTMFNVRLGWWIPNPSKGRANSLRLGFSLRYLLRELAGLADEGQRDLNISDGGHFENLGIYELARRNCTVIIAGDAECDEGMAFGGLANAIRLCETDFGAIIDIDVSALRRQPDGFSRAHTAVGTIKYSNGSIGHLIYIKSSVTGDEDPTIAQYRAAHPTFPHESTADQFFSEDQFESYRRLGLHAVRTGFRCAAPGEHLVTVTQKMAETSAPPQVATERFLRHTQRLNELWEHLRNEARAVPSSRASFLSELRGKTSVPTPQVTDDVAAIGLQLLQLMEDVFVDLQLDDSWDHPDNRGWAMLFMTWARSPRLRSIWKSSRRTFGIRFEHFCANRLGLDRDHPVVRVTAVASR